MVRAKHSREWLYVHFLVEFFIPLALSLELERDYAVALQTTNSGWTTFLIIRITIIILYNIEYYIHGPGKGSIIINYLEIVTSSWRIVTIAVTIIAVLTLTSSTSANVSNEYYIHLQYRPPMMMGPGITLPMLPYQVYLK